jgi:hypothetical protein
MITVADSTVAAFLFVIGGSIFGYLIGGFRQWNQAMNYRHQLHLELEDSYREADHLRSIIFDSDRSQNHNPALKLNSN